MMPLWAVKTRLLTSLKWFRYFQKPLVCELLCTHLTEIYDIPIKTSIKYLGIFISENMGEKWKTKHMDGDRPNLWLITIQLTINIGKFCTIKKINQINFQIYLEEKYTLHQVKRYEQIFWDFDFINATLKINGLKLCLWFMVSSSQVCIKYILRCDFMMQHLPVKLSVSPASVIVLEDFVQS